jgi:hypothetical protein
MNVREGEDEQKTGGDTMKHRHLFYCKYVLGLFVFLFLLSFLVQTGYGAELANQGGPKPKIGERAKRIRKNLQRIRQAVKVQKMHTGRLMEMPDVMGTATGMTSDGEPMIKVFTRRPGVANLPKSLDGFPVKVEVTGMFVAQEDPTARFIRPVPIGVSTGHPAITAGTIGARVKDSAGNVYALSNNHVYANMNAASLGDPVLQPAALDGGTNPADKIGTLSAYKSILFNGGINDIDAAIALSSTSQLSNGTPAFDQTGEAGYGVPSSQIYADVNGDGFFDDKNDLLGLYVQKFGRTSGMTHGQITDINVTVDVCYEPFWIWCFTWGTFVDQIGIMSVDSNPFSEGGDSGSLIVTDDENNQLVGLLFAGNGTKTLANRIDLVLDGFNVTVDGEAANPVTDIEIASVSVPESVVQNDVVEVQVTVQNVGNQDVNNDIVVTLNDNDADYASYTITGGLIAGASTTVIFNWSSSLPGEHHLVARHDYDDIDPDNDSLSTTVTVEDAFIDIGITKINAPSSVAKGENVDVVVKVENLGNRDVGDDVTVTLVDNEGFYANDTIWGGLVVGSSAQITFPWPASSEGTYELVASHDYIEYDDNSSNDSASAIVNVEPAVTDIAITNIDAPVTVSEGNKANVVVRVENRGNKDVTVAIEVQLTSDNATHNDSSDDIAIGTQIIDTGLMRGAFRDVTFQWDTTGAAHDIHALEALHLFSDDVSANNVGTASVEVIPPQTVTPQLRTGKVCANSDTWTKVNLDHTYREMVVVCTPSYDRDPLYGTTMPVVAQVRNTHFGDSFEVKLAQAVGGSVERSEAWVYWMVVEAGVYDLPGVKMEADTFVSVVTDNYSSWVGQSRTYQLPGGYTNPVVLGQVMTYSSELWTSFWCRGSSKNQPPSANSLYVGKHKGEDRWFTRANERIGYIVIEAGSGDIEGTRYVADLGGDTIKGMADSPPYDYPLNGLSFTPSTAIVTQAGMDGGNGGWAIIYGDDPLPQDWMDLAIDEDWVKDGESRHTTEQVGYIVFEEQQFPITIEGQSCQYIY